MNAFLRFAKLGALCLAAGPLWAQGGGNDADLDGFANVPAGDSTVTINVPATPYPVGTVARYFGPAGSNTTGDGLTPATAWRTLTQALENDAAKIPTGATLVFATGRYPVDGVAINRALTLQPAAGARAWLTGSDELPAARWERVGTTNVWRTTAAQPWTARFTNELQNKPETIIGVCPPGGPRATSSDHTACPPTDETRRAGFRDQVFVDDKPLKQALRLADLRPGQSEFFVDEANSRLYIGRNPNGRRLDATAYETALTLSAAGQAANQRIVVRGLGFRHYASEAVSAGRGNVQLENCTFAWGATEGANLNSVMENVLVKGNTFAYNGRLGLGVGTGPVQVPLPSTLVVEDNVFSYNNHEGFAAYWSAGGMKLIKFDDVIIRNNLFDNNYGSGLWMDIDVERVQVLRNIARNNQAIGLFYEICRGGLFAGNLCYGNGTGIQIGGSSGVAVFNNTLVDNKTNLRIVDDPRTLSPAVRGSTFETFDVVVKNNVLGNGEKSNLVVSQAQSNPEAGRMIEPGDLNRNLYLRWTPQVAPTATSGGRYYMVHFNNLGTVPEAGAGLKYATLADFRAAGTPSNAVFEANGTEVSNKPVGQLFSDAAGQDFRLKDCPANWTIPAADQVTSLLVVAAAAGGAPAFSFTPDEFRQALGLAPGAPLRVGGLQQTVGCAGPLAVGGPRSATPADWLVLYPNPAQHDLHLRLANERPDKATLIMHNSLGQEVLRATHPVDARGELHVAVGQLAAGAYWATVALLGSGHQSTQLVLIQP